MPLRAVYALASAMAGCNNEKNDAVSMTPAAPLIRAVRVRADHFLSAA